MRKIIIAKSSEEALEARRNEPTSCYLSGGTEVLRLGSSIPSDATVVDVTKVVPSGITQKDGFLEIGAGATFQSLVDSPLVPSWLKKACHYMASLTLRMQATAGGNIALHRDDSYLVPALIASDALLRVHTGKGTVTESVLDHVTACDDSLILTILIPLDRKLALKRISRSSTSHSAVNVALSSSGSLAVALKGTGILSGREAVENAPYVDDLTGSADYKRYITHECIQMLEEELR